MEKRKACKERRCSKKETLPREKDRWREYVKGAGCSWSALLKALKSSIRHQRSAYVCGGPKPRVHARKIAMAQEAGRTPD